MANKKISELPYINGGKISGNTLVPLVTYFSAATGDTVHTFVEDFQTYLISGLTGNTDVFVTGGTYSAGTITFTNNTGGTFNVTGLTTGSTSIISGEYLPLSGGTVTGSTQFTAGLSANTISATTYLNLPITTDVFVTGGTYTNGDAIFTNNTGGTFTVTGFYTGETSYVNSLTTGVGLSANTTTGDITIINTDPDQVVVLNNGTNINVTGTYPNFTIDVTGLTDFNTFTTGFTYSSNTFTISDNSGSTFDATFTEVTGLTVNGDLNITGTTYSNVISATTYQNLPDNVTGNYLPLSGGTVSGDTIFQSGLTANTISANTLTVNGVNITGDTYVTGLTFNTSNYNLTIGRNDGVSFTDSLAILASDLTVTGGTYNPNNGTATFTNNTGGTFNVTGFLTGFTDTFVTGGTYSAGTITFTNSTGGTFSISGITSTTGPFGISDSGGTYTYYSNLSSAMSAATSGQTIEMFADVTETGVVTVTLKDGVTINGNGHTYNHTQSGSTNTFDTGTAGGTFKIFNLNIVRTNATGGYVLQSGGGLYATLQTFYLDGTTITCNNGAIYTTAYYTKRKFYNGNIILTGSGTGISQFQDSINVYNVNIRATSTCTTVCINGCEGIYNSTIEHEGSPSGFAIVLNTTLYNCSVISRGSTACIATNGKAYNCLFYCAAGSCTYVNNTEFNSCTFISAGGYGTYTEATTYYKNCSVLSTSNYGTVGGAFYNSSIISSVNIATINFVKIENCVIESTWNNVGGHAVKVGSSSAIIKNCSLNVTNSSANCINAASALSPKYANNVYAGATTPVNANITQGITNTQDNYGNILI